jgi:hypothetical protein
VYSIQYLKGTHAISQLVGIFSSKLLAWIELMNLTWKAHPKCPSLYRWETMQLAKYMGYMCALCLWISTHSIFHIPYHVSVFVSVFVFYSLKSYIYIYNIISISVNYISYSTNTSIFVFVPYTLNHIHILHRIFIFYPNLDG